jgi:hypothetical protein
MMNERIDQLRLEAGISRLHDEPKFMVAVSKEGTVIEPLDGLEKFAELIVKECRDNVEQDMKLAHIQMIPLTLEKYANGRLKEKIREHFGVE